MTQRRRKYFNQCLAQTRVKVECVFGQLKKKFQCLTKRPDYQPKMMCQIIRSCAFLWNLGILCGDNKGYNQEEYVIEDEEQLATDEIDPNPSGEVVRNHICNYLWRHK